MPNHSQKRMALIFLLLLVVLSGDASAQSAPPVVTILNNGDSMNRVDIVILGDGFTADEMGAYAEQVQRFAQEMLAQEPFKEYQRYFNVHRIDMASNESGADHPESNPPVFKDTAFDATYNCAGIDRLICVNQGKVSRVLSDALSPSERDIVLICVNDRKYGGSGGSVAVTSIHDDAFEIVLHELGHSFGLLADEYDSPNPPPCQAFQEPSEPNVTKASERAAIKWAQWIDPATPIPTLTTLPALPGLYEGARYCTQGLFRATYKSKMLELGFPFEQINNEQLIKRIYDLVSPIEESSPSDQSLKIKRGQSRTFSVSTPEPLTHSLSVTWFIDGQSRGVGPTFTIEHGTLSKGKHTLEVVVSDITDAVKNDPEQLLTERRKWKVKIK